HQWEACCRPYDQRRADGKEKVAGKRKLLRPPHRLLGHCLTERDRRGFDVTVAFRTVGRLSAGGGKFLLDPGELVAGRAGEAQRVRVVAVQLDHVSGRNARTLVKVVDVLSDDARRLAAPIEGCEREMPESRPRCGKLLLHGEAPPPRFVAHFLTRKEFV